MTKTMDVVPGGSIVAAWGNEVRDRTIQIFASAAERNAAYPTPARGQTCYVYSNDIDEGLWSYDGTAWRKPWNTPWGAVSQFLTNTQATTASSSPGDMGLSVSWTGIANRLYKITFTGYCQQTGATGNPVFQLVTNTSGSGTVIQEYYTMPTTATYYINAHMVTYVTGAGAHAYHMRWSVGGGTLVMSQSSKASWMVAEDVGPSWIGTPA